MRVAISTVRGRADDPLLRSGTPSSIVRALGATNRVELALLPPPVPRLQLGGRMVSYATKRIPGQHKVNWEVEPLLLRRMTTSMRDRAREQAPDSVIMAIGWLPAWREQDNARLVYFNDCGYAQRLDAAPHWSGLGRRSRRMLNRFEGAAMRNLRAVIMESQWAADDAAERYDLDPKKVHAVPGAANIETPAEIHRLAPDGPIRLLATGVEWHRKGIDVAVETVDLLRSRGQDVSLDVLGVTPPDASWHREHVRFHGFLSKAQPDQLTTIKQLYADADVFVFPTRYEPYGIAPIEAMAYSLPVVAPALNALPETVEDGVTGLLVEPGAGAEAYAHAVATICADASTYERMARAGRAAHVNRLNWNRSAELLADLLAAM